MDFSGTGTANIYEDVSYGNHLCSMSDNLMYTSQKNSKKIKIKTVPQKICWIMSSNFLGYKCIIPFSSTYCNIQRKNNGDIHV